MLLTFLLVIPLLGLTEAQVPARLNLAIAPQCRRRTGGWRTSPAFHVFPVVSGGTTTYYFYCRVRRPSWSECYGSSCPSTYRYTWYPSVSTSARCTCCRPGRLDLITPTWAQCKYKLQVINGCWQPTMFNVWVNRFQVNLSKYRYRIVGNCGCRPCPTIFIPTFVASSSVAGAGVPPQGADDLPQQAAQETSITDRPRINFSAQSMRTSDAEFRAVVRETNVPQGMCRRT